MIQYYLICSLYSNSSCCPNNFLQLFLNQVFFFNPGCNQRLCTAISCSISLIFISSPSFVLSWHWHCWRVQVNVNRTFLNLDLPDCFLIYIQVKIFLLGILHRWCYVLLRRHIMSIYPILMTLSLIAWV